MPPTSENGTFISTSPAYVGRAEGEEQQREDDGDGDGRITARRLLRALQVFKLTAPIDLVAGGQLDGFGRTLLRSVTKLP